MHISKIDIIMTLFGYQLTKFRQMSQIFCFDIDIDPKFFCQIPSNLKKI